MPGLLVVGAAHGAAEDAVAEALVAVLRRGGVDASPVAAVKLGGGAAIHGYAAVASPLTAARHAGGTIEPASLVAAVRAAGENGGALVASAGGGLLAPLTARYAVRDLALELALPLVIAVPAGPDAVNLARLTLASARGAGLAVAAITLTGWPDPPDRVLLDERRLLDELAGVPVVTLPAAPGAREDAARRWPAAAWLETAPPAPPPGATMGAPAAPPAPREEIVLEPYEAWESRPLGDPRGTPRPEIMAAILEIVTVEGPMRATRAYGLYNRAAGGKKLTSIARAPLSSAVYWLSRDGRIALTRAEDIPWQDDDLVRLPDAAAVRVRELGPRTLEEVPLDEIAELMRRLRAAGHASDEAGLKRSVLTTYGLVRLTTRADEYLGLAYGLLEAPGA